MTEALTRCQVLVIDDALGTYAGHKPKFARRFAELRPLRDGGVHKYAEAVRSGSFPDAQAESYGMEEEEWERFLKMA
jgi:3-methyl-2-oxobutanoate hydroxymethyltransferase